LRAAAGLYNLQKYCTKQSTHILAIIPTKQGYLLAHLCVTLLN